MSHVGMLARSVEEIVVKSQEADDNTAFIEELEKQKYPVAARLDSMQIQYMDMMAKKIGMSRSALLAELATSALMDVMEKMDWTTPFFEDLVSQTVYDKERTKNV